MVDQDLFHTVYRSRQTWLHHLAYMRTSKVLLARHALNRAGIPLAGKRILDYGFGPGAFFRHCPTSASLFGVELDPVNVQQVARMLQDRGFNHVELESIEIGSWERHPLLQRQYDVVLCSHVLEHLDDPAAFLRRLSQCVADHGVFVGLVPINERERNPHHVQTVNRDLILSWLTASGLEAACYLEGDPWLYWLQPLFNHDADGPKRLPVAAARALSLTLGIASSLLGRALWMALAPAVAWITRSKPTQAAFVAVRSTKPDRIPVSHAATASATLAP